ncbi:MAG: group I intron-associated PD-(D/E)XK endonuclease [Thermoleophilaceae bacterium]
MAPLKTKGDMAELIVAADLVKRGYRVAFPFGEDCDFDLLFWEPDECRLQRVQVKYTESDGRDDRLDRVYDATTDQCFYVPAVELGGGRDEISLRLVPTRNNQRLRIRMATRYLVPTITREGP